MAESRSAQGSESQTPVSSEPVGEEVEAGDQEDDLTRQPHEGCFGRLADRLEKDGGNHLHPHHWQQHVGQSHAVFGHSGKFRIGREGFDQYARHELTQTNPIVMIRVAIRTVSRKVSFIRLYF